MQSALLYAVIELFQRSDDTAVLEEYFKAFSSLQFFLENCARYQQLRESHQASA